MTKKAESAAEEHQLRVLIDAAGKKMAEKMFETYVRREDASYARHPEFLIALDRLLSEFGGAPVEGEKKDDAEDGEFDEDDEDVLDFDEISSFADALVKNVRRRSSK